MLAPDSRLSLRLSSHCVCYLMAAGITVGLEQAVMCTDVARNHTMW